MKSYMNIFLHFLVFVRYVNILIYIALCSTFTLCSEMSFKTKEDTPQPRPRVVAQALKGCLLIMSSFVGDPPHSPLLP